MKQSAKVTFTPGNWANNYSLETSLDLYREVLHFYRVSDPEEMSSKYDKTLDNNSLIE